MLDPNAMDRELGIDRTKMVERYKKMAQEETSQEEEPMEEEQVAFVPPARNARPPQAPQPQPQYHQQPDNYVYQEEAYEQPRPNFPMPHDYPIFEGGPYQSQVDAWKKQFGRIYKVTVEGEQYIFRKITRFEYKQIMSMPNSNELIREEAIAEICTLFPQEYSYETMSEASAGIPSLISEHVMKRSGFSRDIQVEAL